MKNKLSSVLKKVFLSSLAGLAINNSHSQPQESSDINSINELQPLGIQTSKTPLKPKLILKKGADNLWSVLSHTSHSSHRSHSSHSSSSTGSYTTPKPPSSDTKNSSSNSSTLQSSGLSSSYPIESNNGLTASTPDLGSRTLKKGMSGFDVTELINLLLKKQFLKLNDGSTEMTGIHAYDDVVESAVKKFQEANGLPGDGVCGQSTVYYLKNKP